MSTPAIRIRFDAPTAHYQPGDRLSGRFTVEDVTSRSVRAIELSVLWYTAGKGEEDMAVHYFDRLVDQPTRPLELRIPRRFATVMPASPLSYDGVIVKVCWCVRVRMFLSQGQEMVTEAPFTFGNVSAGQIEHPSTD